MLKRYNIYLLGTRPLAVVVANDVAEVGRLLFDSEYRQVGRTNIYRIESKASGFTVLITGFGLTRDEKKVYKKACVVRKAPNFDQQLLDAPAIQQRRREETEAAYDKKSLELSKKYPGIPQKTSADFKDLF